MKTGGESGLEAEKLLANRGKIWLENAVALVQVEFTDARGESIFTSVGSGPSLGF